MFVVKRDGRKEPVHFDKITSRIKKLAWGLSDAVDPIEITKKVRFYLVLSSSIHSVIKMINSMSSISVLNSALRLLTEYILECPRRNSMCWRPRRLPIW